MHNNQRVKDVIPKINGIFGHMNYDFRDEITKSTLDLMFQANWANRCISPVVEIIQSEEGSQLTNEELTTLAAAILEMYKPKWDKLSEIYDIEYDPIHNYLDDWEDTSEETLDSDSSDTGTKVTAYGRTNDVTDTRTDNLSQLRNVEGETSNLRTDNLNQLETRDLENGTNRIDNLSQLETRSLSNTSTRTDNLLETNNYGKTTTRTDDLAEDVDTTVTGSESGNENNMLFGFNSATAVNSDSSNSSNTNSQTTDTAKTNTGTQESVESGSDSVAKTGTQSTQGSESGTITVANTGTQDTSGTESGTVSVENTGTQSDAGTNSVEETIANTGTRTNVVAEEQGGRDTLTNNLAHTEDYTRNRDRSGRHIGNIGNLTSQKQLLEEINLWKWNYMQEILNDVKDFCTLPIYCLS